MIVSAIVTLLVAISSPARAVSPDVAQKLYDSVSPSLVAVQFTWHSELGKREIVGAGVVVKDDGTTMLTMAVVNLMIPDDQMEDFKIIIPRRDADNDEIDAVFIGRDERTNVAFVRPKNSSISVSSTTNTTAPSTAPATRTAWRPVHFVDRKVNPGEDIVSVGLLPKAAGYTSYLAQGRAAANLRGEVPQVMVTAGGLAAVGSPVFNAGGEAIGFVNFQPEQSIFLNDPRNPTAAITNPPAFFQPTSDLEQSFSDSPIEGHPLKLPWIGLPQLSGLNKDVAEFFDLKNQPAVQVGDVIPDAPGAKAGLKRGQVIVKMNGQTLERGDEPEELPAILRRKVLRMKVGENVMFSILEGRGQPLKDVSVTLEEQPKRANTARRYYVEDLGFTVREIVYADLYVKRLKPDFKGVMVGLIKPQGAAQNAKLQNNDLITEINRTPVTDIDQFKETYETFRKQNPKEAVVLVVLREGNTQVIRIEPPQ
jgi:S1-C subfamily serine protease